MAVTVSLLRLLCSSSQPSSGSKMPKLLLSLNQSHIPIHHPMHH